MLRRVAHDGGCRVEVVARCPWFRFSITSLTARDHASPFACCERHADTDRRLAAPRSCWASALMAGWGIGIDERKMRCEVEASPLSKWFLFRGRSNGTRFVWFRSTSTSTSHVHFRSGGQRITRWAPDPLSGAVVSPASPPRTSSSRGTSFIAHHFIKHASPGTQSDSAAPPPSRSAQADGPATQTREASARRRRVRQAADLLRLSVRD